MLTIRKLLNPAQSIPEKYRRNFIHWYFDIFWFGILNGSTLIFLSVYCARLGGSVTQLGFLSAAPGVMNLIFTLPAGMWVGKLPTWKATCFSALLTRAFYALLIPLPFMLAAGAQVWTIIAITLLMNVPGTMLAIVVNSYFAETVPPEYRGTVVGTRNALLSVMTMLTSFVVGLILTHTSLEAGYQIVFIIGFIGAAMSTLHLFLIKPPKVVTIPAELPEEIREIERDARRPKSSLRLDVLVGSSGVLMVLMFLYQLSVFTIGPLFPIYQVNVLNMSDQTISLGTVVFWSMHFLGSTQTGRLSRKMSYKKMTTIGIFFISATVAIFSVSYNFWIYAFAQVISGLGWSLVGGGLLNYLLECFPPDDRQAYLTWYNMAINAAILLASFLGPLLADLVGLMPAMWIVVGMRLLAGVAIIKFGREGQEQPRLEPAPKPASD